jgi:hypothetical protein
MVEDFTRIKINGESLVVKGGAYGPESRNVCRVNLSVEPVINSLLRDGHPIRDRFPSEQRGLEDLNGGILLIG